MSQPTPTPKPTRLSLSLAPQIASYAIQPPTGPTEASLAIELSQARHRIRLINSWDSIDPGNRVLELGCGQGTCTAVLAEAVGETGYVDALDPAPLDYGAPSTLGEAQGWLSKGPMGGRISFHRADPVKWLRDEEGEWDVAVLAHCIWYFRSEREVVDLLNALKGRVKKVLIAEYALRTGVMEAVPHVLATVARAALEAHRKDSSENIQTALSPMAIQALAEEAGWKSTRGGSVSTEAGLSDGVWETGSVVAQAFLDEVEKIEDERVKAMLKTARDAVVSSLYGMGVGQEAVRKVRTMDVSTAVYVPR